MNQEIDINSIVKIEQMPKVMYQLELIGQEIETRLEGIDILECTEENKQEVKKKKQEITAFKNLMEDKRKEIKKKLLEDYEIFNNKYEDEVKGKLINAETKLQAKISYIETEQRHQKENILRDFADEYFEKYNLKSIITFEQIGLNITLSASEKSLKEQIVAFCEKVANDIDAITLEELKDEILVEYKQCLDYAKAKTIVVERYKKLEEIKKQQEEIQAKKEEDMKIKFATAELINEDITVTAPTKMEVADFDEVLEVTFTIYATRQEIKELKQFMQEHNIEYK